MATPLPGMSLREMSSDAIREMAKKYAAYMATFRAEIIKEGLSEAEALSIMETVAHCCKGNGNMSGFELPEIRTLNK